LIHPETNNYTTSHKATGWVSKLFFSSVLIGCWWMVEQLNLWFGFACVTGHLWQATKLHTEDIFI